MKLIVVHPFGVYAKGAEITDAVEIKAILEGENAHHVIKVAADKPEKPAKK
jgi:hypothetical protein